MISIIFLILSLCWVLFFIVIIFAMIRNRASDCILFPLLGILFVLSLNAFPIFSHVGDLSIVRNGHQYIEIRQEAIAEINSQLQNINLPQSMWNKDTPVATFIETKAEYVRDITHRK